MTFVDSGLRWCTRHAALQTHAPVRVGRICAGTPICAEALGQAWNANDERGDWPEGCAFVALLVDDAVVAVDGQGALI